MLTPSSNQLTMPVVWLTGLELRQQTDLVMVCSVGQVSKGQKLQPLEC